MFVMTRGNINDELSKKINKKIGKYEKITCDGILGKLTDDDLSKMIFKMKKDGYYAFDIGLPEETTKAIYDFACKTPVSFLDVSSDKQNYTDSKVIFDENNPIAPRYDYKGSEIFQSEDLQKLIFDISLLKFAQEYLGCKPILDLVAFWWSAPFEGIGKNAAAQMYHFDLDRIKFMKFFIYITDVDSETGPHCFVKGSHGKLPVAINRDCRYEDYEIEQVYGKENMLEICGKKGSIIAVDTRGFHKGKELLKGKRLLFQIQFTNSLFGQSYQPIDTKLINPKYLNHVESYNYSYNHIC